MSQLCYDEAQEMYQEARRGKVLHMQTLTRPNSSGLNQQSRRIATFAILLFALSGLISGFALGAFVKPKIAGLTPNHGSGTTPVAQSTTTTTKTAHENVTVGEPIIHQGDFTYTELADGTTTYTFSALIVYDNTTTPIQASDVTCKIWLTHDLDATKKLLNANHYAVLKDINHIQQPFSSEVPNSLNFIGPSIQTQPCAAGSKTTWTYTLSPSVEHGLYYLFVLADWKGKHYNWYAEAIRVRQAN